MDRARAAGRRVAERQIAAGPVGSGQPDRPLYDYAESSRVGDWSLRSALMRFAQPEALRASRVLEPVRRLDAALHPARSTLERNLAWCDRRTSFDEEAPEAIEPYVDTRVADLARLVHGDPAALLGVVQGYEEIGPLDDVEKGAVALLAVAVDLDHLGDVLADWALDISAPIPVGEVDRTCRVVSERLDTLGVPREQGGPPRGRRDRGI